MSLIWAPAPSTDHSDHRTTLDVLHLLLKHRRRFHDARTPPEMEERDVIAVQAPRIHAFVQRQTRIEFTLPAFPAKSPNPSKVLGTLPDMAERLSIQFLADLCETIRHIYPPGAHLTICSDGHVFADLIGVSDITVHAYQLAMKSLIAELSPGTIDVFNLFDAPHISENVISHAEQRELLCKLHAEDAASLKGRLLASEDGIRLYRAITRFAFEDRLIEGSPQSRTALQRQAKELAIGIIQRSWAWGDLIEREFPDAIRLSIHPQPASSRKLGIHLLGTADNWLTPWHGVALKRGECFTLIKREEANAISARLVVADGQPSDYEVECRHSDRASKALAMFVHDHHIRLSTRLPESVSPGGADEVEPTSE